MVMSVHAATGKVAGAIFAPSELELSLQGGPRQAGAGTLREENFEECGLDTGHRHNIQSLYYEDANESKI